MSPQTARDNLCDMIDAATSGSRPPTAIGRALADGLLALTAVCAVILTIIDAGG